MYLDASRALYLSRAPRRQKSSIDSIEVSLENGMRQRGATPSPHPPIHTHSAMDLGSLRSRTLRISRPTAECTSAFRNVWADCSQQLMAWSSVVGLEFEGRGS